MIQRHTLLQSISLLRILGIICFVFAAFIAVRYSSQALLDKHSFRQTQTALTSLWMIEDGFSLTYQTPVAGSPWSIPFEFPLYQYVVALISTITGANLDATGRITSFIFLLACIFPARSIIQKLKLPESVLLVFICLIFSSPLYLYWGRTFMIETTALFFAMLSIPCYLDIIFGQRTLRPVVLFILFSSLSILQKATTGLPLLAILGLIYLIEQARINKSLTEIVTPRNFILAMTCFGIPLLAGILWTHYTDTIKSANYLGTQLTSQALSAWNWGGVGQRFSLLLYEDVFWRRILKSNFAGWLGVALLLSPFIFRAERKIKYIVLISLTACMLPIMLFTNLHIVHDYYQTASVIYLIFGMSVIIGGWIPKAIKQKNAVLFFTVIIVLSNIWSFNKQYFHFVKQQYTRYENRALGIANILRREIPEGHAFIAFGHDWSSSLAYLSQRKSFTVPTWFINYDEVLTNPEKYLGDSPLGAVVACPNKKGPSLEKLLSWLRTMNEWRIGDIHGCYLLLPSKVYKRSHIRTTNCQGNIDSINGNNPRKHKAIISKVLSTYGWTTISGKDGTVPDEVFITLTDRLNDKLFYEAIRTPRADVNVYFQQNDMGDSGFSRLIDVSELSGEYTLGIARTTNGNLEICKIEIPVEINNAPVE